jgi:hypothetical protein
LKKVLRVVTRLNVGGPSKQILTLDSLFDEDEYEQIKGRLEIDEAA